ncbi:hypothetical protein [Streptomyces olivochromogenes]|uniref:hypothetical protein n=1 Tax=Streptomyces olivochromogenes TaxID=1963 RepID=UPI001F3105EC|nr:hypothetical protein [Streptomyces olivochromogenes]MCF3135970.1 hypothetical protein [Streptomyces olivochromogenes]
MTPDDPNNQSDSRDPNDREPAPVLAHVRVWLLCAAVAAGGAALSWHDSPALVPMFTAFAMIDDVAKGVRHRWPALLAGTLAGWATLIGADAALPTPADSDWRTYSAFTSASLAALAVFVVVTRLPGVRPTGR